MGLTKHHKIPRSQGGGDGRSNIKLVEGKSHQLWHRAWDNKTPTNIVHSLDALMELFGDVKLSELKTLIEVEWS